jgi:hypothetical protein
MKAPKCLRNQLFYYYSYGLHYKFFTLGQNRLLYWVEHRSHLSISRTNPNPNPKLTYLRVNELIHFNSVVTHATSRCGLEVGYVSSSGL